MFLKCHSRIKDGKEHRYWNIVENRRCGRGKFVQRQVLYLGEINDAQRQSWCRTIEIFDENRERTMRLALFPADRQLPNFAAGFGVQIRLKEMELHRPRQWGACWLACYLYEQLGLDEFWAERLADSREGTCWGHILQTLVCYRLIDPGSEWRLHRQWFEQSAMADLLDEDYSLVEKNSLYRCLDKVLKHKEQLFGHLRQRWQDLFGARFEVLLYDLTSTYFESDPVFEETDKRQFGYSRDKRPDCVQVVIALIITPEGFPLAYEVLPGNTSDKTTLRDFLRKIEAQYGKAERIWLMDRGHAACGMTPIGLNRRAVCSGPCFREQPGFQSNPSVLPPERRCEEKGMLSATQTHLAKELSNDTASTSHDRGHAGEELLTAYPKLLRATGLAVRTPFQ